MATIMWFRFCKTRAAWSEQITVCEKKVLKWAGQGGRGTATLAAAEDSMKVTETSLFLELSQWLDVEPALPSEASNGLFSWKTMQRNREETGKQSNHRLVDPSLHFSFRINLMPFNPST